MKALNCHRYICYYFLISLMLLFTHESPVKAAVEATLAERPRLGLALGGGSAAGFAHIGVLQWLEEHRIPVDYIAGTSMGGLMGGCYSMGMSPGEIGDFVRSINWDELFNPNPPYDARDFRRKEDGRNYPNFELGLRRNNVNFPSGLSMYRIDLALSRLTLPYSTSTNFGELPIPFKCTATDIRSGQSVVLADGSLENALRATMAIPGVFSPVERNGQLLVDGGVLNNLPVAVVKEMGAQAVVAVNIVNPIIRRETESIDTVLSQTIDTVVASNARNSIEMADLVLTPSLEELGLINWNAVNLYITRGYNAAAQQGTALQKFALDEASWQQYLVERQGRKKQVNQVPAGIKISGASRINRIELQKRLDKYIGKAVDPLLLEEDLTRLMGSGLYESFTYEYFRQGQEIQLLITAKEKKYGPPFVNFALISNTDGIAADNLDLNLHARVTSYNVWGVRSEFRLDLGIGTELDLASELYFPLGDGNWFVAPGAYLKPSNNSWFESGRRVTNYKVTTNGQRFDLGYSFSQFAEGRIGYLFGMQDIEDLVGKPLNPKLSGSIRAAQLEFSYSSGDEPILPRRGLTSSWNGTWYYKVPGAVWEFGAIESKTYGNIPVGERDSLFLMLAGGATFHNDPPLIQQFKLGGPFRLGAYYFNELSGNNYLLGNIGYLKSISRSWIGNRVYLGLWLESGNVFSDWQAILPKENLSVGLLSATVFGPLYLGVSFGRDRELAYHVRLGQMF